MSARLSVDEWLSELEAISRKKRDDGGMTIRELAEAAGVCRSKMLDMVGQAHRLGRVTVGRRSSFSISGKPCTVPTYIITAASKEKRRKLK